MSADFRKVRPGQPLRITAKAWNRVLDSVATQPEFLGGGGAYGRINHVVQIKNTTGSTVPKWGVLEITGVVNDPAAGDSSLAQFQEVPILEGAAPSSTTAGKFVVAVEPIAAGKFGRAAIDGVVQVKVEVDKATDKFVTCKASASELKTGPRGEGLILWKEDGTGTSKWAIVRLGGGADGVIRGTFSGTWTKGSTTTVTDAVISGATYTAKNYIATLSGSVCLIAHVADEWVLVGWDWHSMTGYDATKQQVLAHAANGGLAWIDTTACT